jgi:heme-degrading monooxygenase HmoA
MFARVTLVEIDTVRIDMDSAVEVFRANVLPEVRKQPGYAGVLVMTTPEGNGAIVSFWDTADDADATAGAGFYSDVLQRHMTMFKSPPGRERYEVRVVELLPASTPV